MTQTPRGPMRVELDDLPGLDAGEAIPDPVEARAEARLGQLARATGAPGWLGRWFRHALAALVALALGVWAWDFATGMLDRSPLLGGIATGLILALLGLLVALSLREWAALARLNRIDRLRARVVAARAAEDMAGASRAVDELTRLCEARAEAAWGLTRLAEQRGDLLDASALLDLAEREVLRPLDAAARAEIEAAAARVATLTALIPLALVDVGAALWTNLAMIRRLAAIYGGRSGTIGAWRLTRAVVGHLAVTGAVAVGDDLLGPALGGGMAGKLSRRFGEGVINGALTIRVGVVAMELCRPMPFVALERPGRAAMMRRAVTGVFAR